MSNPTDDLWFYARNNQQMGPVSRAQLEQLVLRGEVNAGDLVWTAGMSNWEPAAQVFPNAIPPTAIPMGIPTPGNPNAPISYYNPMLTGGLPYVGFWWRVLAALIDGILISIVGQIINIAIYLPLGLTWDGESADAAAGGGPPPIVIAAFFVTFLLNTAVGWIYEAWMTSSKYRATLGKLAIGVEVLRSNGEPISFARATGRHFAKFLSYILLFVGYLMVAFTQKKQGLHDFMCDTIVVKKRTW